MIRFYWFGNTTTGKYGRSLLGDPFRERIQVHSTLDVPKMKIPW